MLPFSCFTLFWWLFLNMMWHSQGQSRDLRTVASECWGNCLANQITYFMLLNQVLVIFLLCFFPSFPFMDVRQGELSLFSYFLVCGTIVIDLCNKYPCLFWSILLFHPSPSLPVSFVPQVWWVRVCESSVDKTSYVLCMSSFLPATYWFLKLWT